MKPESSNIGFSTIVQDFFCQRLINQRNVTMCTLSSYRDTFRLLLRYAEHRLKKSPEALTVEDLSAQFVLDFLHHLENVRGNSVRTRNTRLSVVRSFMRYVALRDPISLAIAGQVRAIPTKRFDKPLLEFLTREEMEAILSAPDTSTWSGYRDKIMFATLYNTGARVSEITRLQREDLSLDREASVRIKGKGRKKRVIPLWKSTAKLLKQWLSRIPSEHESPLFPNRMGQALTRSGVEYRLRKAAEAASKHCASLKSRKVSPHVVRHTTGMHLLQSGVDITVIALWLGHETPATTHQYVEADLAMKERALKTLQDPKSTGTRYKPTKGLLAFLEGL